MDESEEQPSGDFAPPAEASPSTAADDLFGEAAGAPSTDLPPVPTAAGLLAELSVIDASRAAADDDPPQDHAPEKRRPRVRTSTKVVLVLGCWLLLTLFFVGRFSAKKDVTATLDNAARLNDGSEAATADDVAAEEPDASVEGDGSAGVAEAEPVNGSSTPGEPASGAATSGGAYTGVPTGGGVAGGNALPGAAPGAATSTTSKPDGGASTVPPGRTSTTAAPSTTTSTSTTTTTQPGLAAATVNITSAGFSETALTMRSGAVITFKNTVDRARVVRSPSGVLKTLAKDNGSDTFTAESGTYELRRSNGDVLDTLTVTVV